MEEDVRKLNKDLRDYSSGMGKRVREEINLKMIEANYEADIINTLASDGKIANPSRLTDAENSLVRKELRKIRNKEVLEGVRKVSKDFFDKEQEALEKMQKSLDDLVEEAKKEAEQVEKDIKALEEKQKAHEEDDKNPELTEDEKNELKELQKKSNYFKNIFPNKLKSMKQKIALARNTIKYQKEALNVECQEKFGGFAVHNEGRTQDAGKDEFDDKDKRVDRENEPEKVDDEDKEVPGEDEPIVGNEQGNQAPDKQTNQRVQQGGYGMPMFGGAPMGQQVPFTGTQQSQQAPQQMDPVQQQNGNAPSDPNEHLPTEAEIFGGDESPIFRFNKDEMTASEALEFIRRYSAFSAEDRRKCINAGGLDVIEKATETLNVKGGSLSKADKNLLAEYSKTISKSSIETADLVAKDLEKPAQGGQTLSNALKMRTDDPEFKEIQKYFSLKRKLFDRSKKPEVIYNYDNIPDDIKDLLNKAQDDFAKRQENAQKAIEQNKKMLNDPTVSAEQKNKIKESIELETDKMLRDKQNFDRTFGSVIRTGKAIAYNKKIEEMADRVQTLTAKRGDDTPEQDEPDFNDNLHNQTRNDDDRAAEKEQKVNQKFQENLEKFKLEMQEQIENGEEIIFDDYLKFNQYAQYTLKGKYGLSLDSIMDIDMSKANRNLIDKWEAAIKEIQDKANIIENSNKEDLSDDMLLSASEIHILVGTQNIDIDRIEKYASKEAIEEYKEKYDLRSKAEREVEEADKSKDEPDLDDPTID